MQTKTTLLDLVKRRQRNGAVLERNVGQESFFLKYKLLIACLYADVIDSGERENMTTKRGRGDCWNIFK